MNFSIEQEHRAWVPDGYREGIKGQRFAICGHSHSCEEGQTPELTQQVLEGVVSGEVAPPFFNKVMTAFGYKSPRHFWSKVLFFNFIPTCVVPEVRRTEAGGTQGQVSQGRARVLRLLEQHRPAKLLVFSRKVMWALANISLDDRSASRVGPGQIYESYGGHRSLVFYGSDPKRTSQKDLNAFVKRCMAAE
jgi:hypothetical protein